MGRWPGIADRLRVKLRERGYWNAARDRPQLMRFAAEHGFRLLSVMTWIDGKQPSYENLLSLAAALDTTPAWLMFGEDGGRELVAAPAAPSRRSKSRASKIVGAVALLGASLSGQASAAAADVATPIETRGHTYKAPLCNVRRRGRDRRQLALDLVAA
jgi:hypothetical protein